MLLAWLVSAQAAEPACPFPPEAVVAAAARSVEAVADDDPEGHREALGEVLNGLPCLEAELPRTAWGQLLLDEAIVRFAQAAPHRDLLAAALRADPTLAPPPFLLDGGTPASEFPTVPGALRWPTTIDGAPIDGPVAMWGLHVVQARTETGWLTLVVEDAGLPPTWLAAPTPVVPPAPDPVPAPRRAPGTFVTLAVGLGWEDRSQVVDQPGELLGDALDRGPAFTAGGTARGSLAGPLGVAGAVSLRVGGPALPTGTVALALGSPAVAAWLGGAVVAVPLDDIGGQRLVLLPLPALGLSAAVGGDRPLDVWVGGGLAAGVWEVEARWGTALARLGDAVSLRLGTDVSGVGASFVQDPPGLREVSVVQWSGALTLGLTAGR